MISRESPPLVRNATKATIKESTGLIPAAQYVRMSTEDQQYSIANQESVIADYAREGGFEVISTYSDPGRSGVSIRSRKGLRQLLSDVIGGKARFRAILVYDVTAGVDFRISTNPLTMSFYAGVLASQSTTAPNRSLTTARSLVRS
jgi:hypothetical protein